MKDGSHRKKRVLDTAKATLKGPLKVDFLHLYEKAADFTPSIKCITEYTSLGREAFKFSHFWGIETIITLFFLDLLNGLIVNSGEGGVESKTQELVKFFSDLVNP